jgi:cyclopropane-fatty-acyl-phospholipid synthase
LAVAKIAVHPDLYFGEAYMDGALVLEKGDLRQLLDLCSRNIAAAARRHGATLLTFLQKITAYFHEWNSRRDARRNIRRHYDLQESLFRSFLDEDIQYSCAYFRPETQSLEQAQLAKKDHIIAKLLLKPAKGSLTSAVGGEDWRCRLRSAKLCR